MVDALGFLTFQVFHSRCPKCLDLESVPKSWEQLWKTGDPMPRQVVFGDNDFGEPKRDNAGWWFLATPLKNMSSSIGMMTFPINMGK